MKFNFIAFKKTFLLFLPFIVTQSARKRTSVALCLIFSDIVVTTALPYTAKHLVDGLSFPLMSQATLLSFVILLGLFWTLDKISTHVQEIIFFPVVNGAIRDLNSKVIQHLHSIPMETYQNLSSADILSSLKRISLSARSFIRILCLLILPSFIKLIITTTICIKLGAFGFALLPGLLASFWMLCKATRYYIETRDAAWNITDAVTMRLNDSVLQTKMARFFFDIEMQSVNSVLEQEANLWNQTNRRLHSIHIAIALILGSTMTCILCFAGLSVIEQRLTVGDFVMLKGQLIATFLPFKSLSLEFRQLAEAVVDIGKIRRILEFPTETLINQKHPENSPGTHSTCVSLKNLHYHYATKPLLFNLCFTAQEGDSIVILGANGCGKSSLLHMISGLIQPQQGSVLIYGNPRTHYSLSQYRALLHFIPQEIKLFNQTLYDNLCYGCPKISENELQTVIEITRLTKLISQAKLGLNTLAGDMGIRLSGGEKHRLALARALLLKPKILLLDETLDTLDLKNDTALIQALMKTIPCLIMVSHHPTALSFANRILTLEGGSLHAHENDKKFIRERLLRETL